MAVNVCRSICIIIGFVTAAIALVLGFYVFPILINKNIDDAVKLVNGTEGYERWETIPLPLFFKIYFFNVTNPEEVRNGEKPRVKEIGPYVYNEYRHKHNITEQGSLNISYYQNQIYKFNQEASGNLKESDIITVSNLALMSILAIADKRGGIFSTVLSKVIHELFDDPDIFITTSVQQFLFNGTNIRCDKVKTADKKLKIFLRLTCNTINEIKPAQLKKLEDGRYVFSFLDFKNNTHDGHYKINTGVNDINMLAKIYEWNDSPQLNVWKQGSTCNKINGTDTSIYPPHRDSKSKIETFQSDICRSLNLHYHKETEYMGISGLRYELESDVLNYSNHPENDCFCVKKTNGIIQENGCLYDGALELANCQKVPVVMTFPHFYLAHDKYKETVDGLNPNASIHTTFVELEPSTGTVLRGSKRVQINIFYKKVPNINITDKLATTLMPVLWLDEGIELNQKYINLLNDKVFNILTILTAVQWTLFAVGLGVALIGFIWCICARAERPLS